MWSQYNNNKMSEIFSKNLAFSLINMKTEKHWLIPFEDIKEAFLWTIEELSLLIFLMRQIFLKFSTFLHSLKKWEKDQW